jgi:hypothetical protein
MKTFKIIIDTHETKKMKSKKENVEKCTSSPKSP